jgi:hypothetical protein
VKLAFAAVLAGIEAALSIKIGLGTVVYKQIHLKEDKRLH